MVNVPATGASGLNQTHNTTPHAKPAAQSRMNGAPPNLAPPGFPYSARRSAPLDMNTVERKGHPSSRDAPQRSRPHGLMEAPTFRPTEAEFRDPMEYIRSISEKASKYGICKIIPPDSWNPDFAIDLERFHFRTRRQELNFVEGGNRTNLNYLDQLAKFHKQYGQHLNRFPSVDKRPLDLYKLKKAVEVRGGFEKVCKDKKWAEIGRDLGYSGKIMSSLSTSLKNSYQRWLFPYEQYLRTAKPGVHQQMEYEYGGAYSPSNGQSPMVRPPSHAPPIPPPGMMLATSTMQASAALNSSLDNPATVNSGLLHAPPSIAMTPGPTATQQGSPPSAPPLALAPPVSQGSSSLAPQPPQQHSVLMPQQPPRPAVSTLNTEPLRQSPSGGFTAVNNSGFAAVNVPAGGFVAVNQMPTGHAKSEGDQPAPPQYLHNHPPTYPPPGQGQWNTLPPPLGTSLTPNGHDVTSNPLKRTLSQGSINGESGSDGVNGEVDAYGRRSKRPKKDSTPNHAGGQLAASATHSTTPQMRSKSTPRKQGEKCDVCGKTEDKGNILVCDSCELGYHRYCLDPPLVSFPDYDWQCSRCLVGTGDYGFEEGSIYSLKHFQEKANNFKDHYFKDRLPYDPVTNLPRKVTEDDVEREFWRLVENLTETVEVEYGADIHSTTHGSGFPMVEKSPLNPYARDPWNLNVLPFHEESLFRHIKGDISGMTVPWLYVGMCFSTFCWHNEDHYAYSANYQHFGATKTWYGIPGKDASAFEQAMREAVPELFETQPDLLFQLVTILPPEKLRKAGVEVYALDQRAGQFVITFPQAYHAGFNHGFNFNEAVNFAPADWEPFGETGVQRLQEFRRPPAFSHDELLLTAAASDSTIKTAKWLAPALERLLERELSQRDQLRRRHAASTPHDHCNLNPMPADVTPGCGLVEKVQNTVLAEEEYQCVYCKAYAFVAQFRCNTTGKVSCLLHPELLDCCSETVAEKLHGAHHTLILRYTDQELKHLVQKVVDRSHVPEAWQQKLANLLESDGRPPLRALHTLLTEGDKIPYPLSGLDELSDFVKRCDAWVEEANLYLTRKQQNRGKNEKAWRRKSLKGHKVEEKEAEPPLTLERMRELLDDGEQLGFQAPQLENLAEKLATIDEWRSKVKIIMQGHISTAEELDALLEEGRSFMAAMPELTDLDQIYQRTRWTEDAQMAKANMANQSLDDCKAVLARAVELEISPLHPDVVMFHDLVKQGEFWEIKAKEVMAAEDVHYPQLESLHTQVQQQRFPVNKETLAQMDVILAKNREAKRQIITLVDRSHNADFRERPMYIEARDIMKTVEDLNGKPHGTAELEKELKRHEDWMRKGKKLFGKANAPLHILEQHMKIVEEKNNYCFDLNDTFRPPVEPASRDASPVEPRDRGGFGEDEKPIFCICRQPEAGLMIMCEICHDWYHAKCLKLARGKVKETETFTCPICDWRVKIPRDAARPKLEDLQQWAEELPDLPFQPEEEDLLNRIIDKAQAFRDFLTQYTNNSNGSQLCRTSEEMPEILFYLRKIEGAEILLSYETNIFRQELHKWQPIAPMPPPILEQSLSTRKPRPTKQQKLMKELGVEKVEDLPPHLRTKQYVRRKLTESFVTGTLLPKPQGESPGLNGGPSVAPGQMTNRSNTPVGMPRQASTGNAPFSGHPSYDPSGFMPTTMSSSTPFGTSYVTSGPSPYPPRTPSPMFSPANSQPADGFRDSMMPSTYAGPSSRPGQHDHSIGLFEPRVGLGIDGEDDIRNGLANPNTTDGAHAPDPMSSPHVGGEYDNMFMEMTHHDGTAPEEAAPLEQDASQASEALEMIRSASHGSGGGPEGAGEGNNFEDYLNP